MIDFIDEDHLGRLNGLLRNAGQFHCAVAYWGSGAVKALDLKQAPERSIIICNLFSPGCNPHEVEELWKLKRFNLRRHNGLQAKVYWTDKGVCIGSSNASGAGLDFERGGASEQREANVICTEQHVINDVLDWLNKIAKESEPITRGDLENAKKKYQPNVPSEASDWSTLPTETLEKLAVLVWSGETTKQEDRQIEKMRESQIENTDWYVDLPKNVKKYPYGYTCLTFQKTKRGLGKFEVQCFDHQDKWQSVDVDHRVVFASDCRKTNGAWMIPGFRLIITPKMEKKLRKLILERHCKLDVYLTGPDQSFGITTWESLPKLLRSSTSP
jgi:hypothetical protein